MSFIKLNRTSESMELIKCPNAFALLTLIALRARRDNEFNIHNLQIGEALIGDCRAFGMSQREYRTAKQQLIDWSFIRAKTTNKGTIATILDTRIYDINKNQTDKPETSERQARDKRTTSQRQANDKPETTNKNIKELKEVKEVKELKEKSTNVELPQSGFPEPEVSDLSNKQQNQHPPMVPPAPPELPTAVTPVIVSVELEQSAPLTTKHPVKSKKVPLAEKVPSLHAKLRYAFEEVYRKKFDTAYYWTAKDATAMKQMILKLQFKVREKFPEITDTDEKVMESFQHILISINDSWLLDNFSMPVINSKFNEILISIKNNYGRNSNNNKSIGQQFQEMFGHMYAPGNTTDNIQV